MAGVNSWRLSDSKNLRKDELDALFQAAKKHSRKAYLMIALAYNGAMRVGELIHVNIRDFNFTTGKLSILPLKKAGRRRVRDRLTGQVKIVERDVPPKVEYPMPMNVMQLAQEYIKGQKLNGQLWLFPGRTTKCHVVKLNCPGGYVSKREVQFLFDELCDTAKIKLPGRGIHSLKHARLTEVAEKSKDPYLVKEIGRHESVAMSDHYVRYIELRQKVDEIGGRL